MLNAIKVNSKALETMLFIWASLRDKEKISDAFLIELAESPEMGSSYDSEFDVQSVRKVLSAISNRELLNGATKKESRFWNYNMWMLEDPDMTDMMLAPIKKLNLDSLKEKFSNLPYDKVEVVFYPGQMESYKVIDNKIFINFFIVKADLFEEGKVLIEEKEIIDFVEEKLSEIK